MSSAPTNFYDTDNTKEMPSSKWKGSPYRESDWKFYKCFRDTNSQTNPKRLTLYSGGPRPLSHGELGRQSGWGWIQILAPTPELVTAANKADQDYNRCSYVILYRTGGKRIVFGGDSHDETWDHILDQHKVDVTNIDLLIAPHHGRKSVARTNP